ncbi:MAG: VCBS repeat-containing protein, partial [Planctomycetota bacterium]
SIAQASPIFGSQLVDVNGDGNLDLYVVQNFYGPQRETGYMDGGVSLLMFGSGDGQFKATMAADSGLLVRGDATSLTMIDLNDDAKPDFVVGKNNEAPEIFENQQEASLYYSIQLNELLPKELLIGAKIWAEYSDGTRQLHEIRSSQGYLSSDSTATRFFGTGIGKRLSRLEIKLPGGKTIDHVVQSETSNETGASKP